MSESSREKIQQLLDTATKSLEEASQVARETGESFVWNGPNHNIGAEFTPRFEDSDGYFDSDEEEWSIDSWMPSSALC